MTVVRTILAAGMREILLLQSIVAMMSLHIEFDGARGLQPPEPWHELSLDSSPKQQRNHTNSRKGIVNLDLHPWERWKDVILENRAEVLPYLHEWNTILASIPAMELQSWNDAIGKQMSLEMFEEAYSIVKYLNHTDVNDISVVLLNAVYELGMPLTSSALLAAGEDGRVLHGHTQGKPSAPIAEITFVRKGRTLFTAPVSLGSIGIHAAVNPGKWSFSQIEWSSARDSVNKSYSRLMSGGKIPSIMMRQFLEMGLGFDKLLYHLQAVPLVRAQKFVLGGPKSYQGLVISRTPDPGYRHVQSLGPNKLKLYETREYGLTEQKVRGPHDSKDVRLIDTSKQEDMNPGWLITTMKNPPIRGPGTLFTFIMIPRSGQSCTIYSDDIDDDRCSSKDWNGWDDIYSAAPPDVEEPSHFHHAVRPPGQHTTSPAPLSWGMPLVATAVPSSPPPKGPRMGTWRDYASSPIIPTRKNAIPVRKND